MTAQMKKVRTVDEYIDLHPERVQEVLRRMRNIVHDNAPGVEEAMAYGIPTFRLKGDLVHFGAYEKHVSLYPTPSVIDAFKDRLAGYKLGRGTVQFPLDRPIPYDLIAEIVRFRVKQSTSERY